VRYTLNDFLEMRRNNAAYTVFYSTFVPVVVGRLLLKKLVADKDTVEEVATISNNGDRWDDIFTRCKGDVRPYAKGQDIPEEHKTTVPTKYTVSSNPDANSDKEGTNKAWSSEGILRFNQLRKGIIQDRAAHPEFLPAWLAHERDLIVPDQTTSNPGQEDTQDADDDYTNTASPNQTEELKSAAQVADVVDNTSVQHAPGGVEEDDFFGNQEH
jgi:hypothetical protein